jgi:phage terminase large subunit-like protein
MATRQEYADVVIVAADKDQAKDRVLRAAKYAVEHGPLNSHSKVYRDVIELDNNSLITAVPADWQSAAGGNFYAVIFDELHAWTYEGQRRLFDEMLIPPTQPHGVRWMSSYAGWLGESELLLEWWNRSLNGAKISDLPIYHNADASLLAFVDVGEQSWRMPWMDPKYIAEVKESERPNTFRRLWLNEWVTNESQFLPEGAWDACLSKEVKPLSHTGGKLIFGADASTTRDLTALVGCEWNLDTGTIDVRYVKTWKPVKLAGIRFGKPTVDLSDTIGAEILRLHAEGCVDSVYYDPYQLHSIAVDLEKAGIRMIELPQTTGRIEADQALYDAVISKAIRHYGDPTLNEHMRNAVAIETPRGFRLAKEKTSLKIDAAVALSMAHYGAISTKGAGEWGYVPDIFDDSPRPEGALWIPILHGHDFI